MKPTGFSPKARWDRRMPQQPPNDPNQLNEKIQVLAWFKGAKIHPRLFVWNHKNYKVREITYNWQERQGGEIISYFSVSTGTDLYQISFNNTSFAWRLDKVMVE
jgi:hypothetical protein